MTAMTPQLLRHVHLAANVLRAGPSELAFGGYVLRELARIDAEADELADVGVLLSDHTPRAIRWVTNVAPPGQMLPLARRLDLSRGLIRSVRAQGCGPIELDELADLVAVAEAARPPRTAVFVSDWIAACSLRLWERDEVRAARPAGLDLTIMGAAPIEALAFELENVTAPVLLEVDGCIAGSDWTTTLEALDRLDPALGWRHRLRFLGPQLRRREWM